MYDILVNYLVLLLNHFLAYKYCQHYPLAHGIDHTPQSPEELE